MHGLEVIRKLRMQEKVKKGVVSSFFPYAERVKTKHVSPDKNQGIKKLTYLRSS
jgi:hypothetical protein